MTTPTELIQRLRDWRGDPDEVMAEAADALEQQAAQLADAHTDRKNLDCLYRTIDRLTAETEQQAAEIAALRADAERYRAIRRPDGLLWPFSICDLRDPMNANRQPPYECIGETLDAAIDAALRQEQQAKGEGA